MPGTVPSWNERVEYRKSAGEYRLYRSGRFPATEQQRNAMRVRKGVVNEHEILQRIDGMQNGTMRTSVEGE